MDRQDWLDERRREAEERYSTLWAPLYDTEGGIYPNASHQDYMRKFLSLFLDPGTILDAACGAPRGAIKQYLKGKETIRKDSSMPQYCGG